MPATIQVIFYSMYGHVYQMAEAVTAGTRDAGEVSLWQVPELVPDEILEKSGAAAARAAFAHAFAHVPIAKPTKLPEADAIIFGTPTRFGNMAAQMRNFLDQTGTPPPAYRLPLRCCFAVLPTYLSASQIPFAAESWPEDGSASAGTAGTVAVLSLLFAVLGFHASPPAANLTAPFGPTGRSVSGTGLKV